MAPRVRSGAVHDVSFRAAIRLLRAGSACALALLAATGCASAPPAQDTSIAVVPPTTSSLAAIPAPSASAPPPSIVAVAPPPPPPPSPAPSAAPAIDRHTCRPRSPAVTFEVDDDDVVVPLDAQGCPLGESHFKSNGFSYQASVDFMTELQRRLKAGDKEGLADLANFPLRVNHGKSKPLIVKDRAAFLRSFDQIYPPAVASAVAAADVRDLFANYQGVMLGQGIVWAHRTEKGHYGVIAVNPP
jgi:hypothetical protein